MSYLEDWNDPYGFQSVSLAQDVIDELREEIAHLRAQVKIFHDAGEEWEERAKVLHIWSKRFTGNIDSSVSAWDFIKLHNPEAATWFENDE